MIVLDLRHRQKIMSTIDNICLRLSFSYRTLNTVTKTFTFSMPRCSESVEDFGDFNAAIFHIKLDNCKNYYQIQIRKTN